MKTLFNYPVLIYVVAGFASLAIMIIIDYLLGAEAEHLNAWAIVNKLFGRNIGIPDSLAIRNFGLYGAAFLMFITNMIFGSLLIVILKNVIRFIHLIFS